ncbi:IS66 family transposase [Virgibacillus doumboii]|uniref:IS66 family transposase n=1 Tax=Virgibacillus doumboii TaxID=2697503 RepID=UPI0013DEB0AF|nr:IS66 family transposase [Virgibacillus doumboii]
MENTAHKSKETIEYFKAQNEKLEIEKEALEAKLKWYEEQFRLSQQRRFGSSSEKTDSNQLSLFNETEDTADSAVEEPTVETITYKRKKQRGQCNQKLENLPTETIEYRLSDEEQVCSCCNGALHDMSTEVRKELKVIPAQVKVVEHVRHIYSCRHCERYGMETPIVTAKMPEPVFPGSLASPSAMAYTMTQKYVEGMPLYRQEKHLERFGVFIPRQTLANWMVHGANWLELIYNEMHTRLLELDIAHADETTLQVLAEPERPAASTSYMWLYRSGQTDVPIVLYDYQQTRAGKHPRRFLEGFKGYLNVDGYPGYNGLSNVTLVGCWAHARRKFTEALKALPESAATTTVKAEEGLAFCNQLFDIERKLKDKSPQERYEQRLERSQPVLDAFLAWLQEQTPRVLPKSALGKAIKYCRKQWEHLEAFLEDGRLEIDNNRAERSIKPFVIGSKAWLFSNTAKGARSSAIIYSIVETAKENGLNPFNYLSYLFEELPNMDTTDKEQLAQYLPWSATLPRECHVPNKSK